MPRLSLPVWCTVRGRLLLVRRFRVLKTCTHGTGGIGGGEHFSNVIESIWKPVQFTFSYPVTVPPRRSPLHRVASGPRHSWILNIQSLNELTSRTGFLCTVRHRPARRRRLFCVRYVVCKASFAFLSRSASAVAPISSVIGHSLFCPLALTSTVTTGNPNLIHEASRDKSLFACSPCPAPCARTRRTSWQLPGEACTPVPVCGTEFRLQRAALQWHQSAGLSRFAVSRGRVKCV